MYLVGQLKSRGKGKGTRTAEASSHSQHKEGSHALFIPEAGRAQKKGALQGGKRELVDGDGFKV